MLLGRLGVHHVIQNELILLFGNTFAKLVDLSLLNTNIDVCLLTSGFPFVLIGSLNLKFCSIYLI